MAEKWRKENPWYISFANARRRCGDKKFKHYKYYGGKGIKFLLTLEEIKELWFRDKAYEMEHPSIDRVNSNENYIFNNCQFLEKIKNTAKARNKITLQFDLNGVFIKEWESTREIERELNFHHASISACCNGKSKFSHNFIWKYKGE